MDAVIYHLHADELDKKLLKSIKALFKGRITLTISADTEEQTQPSLQDIIEEGEKVGYSYKFSAEEFSRIASDFEKNPDMDVTSVFEAHKVYK